MRLHLTRLYGNLPKRRRRQLAMVLAAMLLGGVAEIVSLGALLPFLSLVADPSRFSEYPGLAPVFKSLGWRDAAQMIVPVSLIFACAALTAGVLRILIVRLTNRFAYGVGHDFGSEIYWRVLHQPYTYHLSRNTSEVVSAINKVQIVTHGILLPVVQSFGSLTIGLCIVLALVILNPVVSLASFAGFGSFYVIVALVANRRLRLNSKVLSRTQSQRIQALQEGLGGVRDVIIDSTQALFHRRFVVPDAEFRHAQATNAFIGAAPRFAIEAMGMVLIAAIAVLTSSRPGGVAQALPVLGVIAVGAQRLLPLMQQLYQGRTQIVGNWNVLKDVLDLLETPLLDDQSSDEEVTSLKFERTLKLKNVSFCYSEGRPEVLSGLDLVIHKGSKVGFVGATGSGKSTTADLLMGLLEPTGGVLLVDDLALGSHNRRAWRKQIAHVPQAIFLLDATIAENIAFGVDRSKIDIARVEAAARASALAGFVNGLPLSYDTMVGERGVRLSGGQRQRIGIARALYKQASVLVFDEATSALDVDTEAAVMDAIDSLASDLTVIIIAHRLSTVAKCDKIFKLDRGRLAAEGDYRTVVLQA